jgi:hypothetical protein
MQCGLPVTYVMTQERQHNAVYRYAAIFWISKSAKNYVTAHLSLYYIGP